MVSLMTVLKNIQLSWESLFYRYFMIIQTFMMSVGKSIESGKKPKKAQ
ncbi:MAG: hypothetical protein JJ933_06465 [Roseivirga sp.]|nr:hypothetical protein [Roseivirga sp.]